LNWDSSRATTLILRDETAKNTLVTTEGVASKDKDELMDGKMTLKPKKDTSYLLTVKRGSKEKTCRVKVEVESGASVKEVTSKPLIGGINLSEVPYTGFAAGPILTLLFYVLLLAWALYLAYLLVIKRDSLGGVKLAVANTTDQPRLTSPQAIRPDVFVQSVTTPDFVAVPTNLPTTAAMIGYANRTEAEVAIAEVEDFAHARRVLLSSEAVRHFLANNTDGSLRLAILGKVIDLAKTQYPAEDGWVVVNEGRMQELCISCVAKSETVSEFVTGTGSLAEMIASGNVVSAYELIGSRPMLALADAVADFDRVFRIRQGETGRASEMLMQETAKLSDEQLREVIASLTSALDGTYTDEASAVKMAIMKAVQVVA
jgi:hypothetical protein